MSEIISDKPINYSVGILIHSGVYELELLGTWGEWDNDRRKKKPTKNSKKSKNCHLYISCACCPQILKSI